MLALNDSKSVFRFKVLTKCNHDTATKSAQSNSPNVRVQHSNFKTDNQKGRQYFQLNFTKWHRFNCSWCGFELKQLQMFKENRMQCKVSWNAFPVVWFIVVLPHSVCGLWTDKNYVLWFLFVSTLAATTVTLYSFNPLWTMNTTIFQQTSSLYHILEPTIGRLIQKNILGSSLRSSQF